MTRCIIHIGMHKTGSTSIQGSLNGFSNDRFLYAKLGNAPNHSLPMYSLFATRPERHHLHKASRRDTAAIAAYIAGVRTDLERAIAQARGRTLVISGEDIGILEQPNLVTLRDHFLAQFDEVAIVGYVRPPAGFMASGFQQRIKGGSVDRLSLERAYRNYENSFAKFDAVFGRERVHLWKFDPKAFPGGCAVQDFCSRLGIALPIARIVRLNESLSRQAVNLLYIYRKLGQQYGSRSMKGVESHKLGTLLAKAGNDKFRFSPEVVRPVLERHRSDIEWMEARLGQSLLEELGGHQPGDVREESDLLNAKPELVRKLLALLGDAAPDGVMGETPEEVALLVHVLREKHKVDDEIQNSGRKLRPETARTPIKQGDTQMKVTELIEQMRQMTPKLLDGIPEDRAAELVRGVFRHINDTLAGTEQGVIKYDDLGRFRVRKVEKDEGGQKITRTQVIFRRAEAGDAKAKGGGGRGEEGRRKRRGKGRRAGNTGNGGEVAAQG